MSVHRTSFVVPAVDDETVDRGSMMANPKTAADKAIRDFFEWTSEGNSDETTWLKVSPNSNFVTTWNVVSFFAALFSVIAIPFYLAYDHDPSYGGDSLLQGQYWYVVAIYAVDIFFAVDIWLHFQLPYINSDGDVEARKSNIRAKYRRSSIFKLSLLAVLPFELVFSWLNVSAPAHAQWNFLTTFRLLQLNRLLRIFVLVSKLSSIARALSLMSETKRIVSMLCSFLCAAHVFACLFYLIGRLELEASSWVEEPWVIKHGVSTGNSWMRKYMASIYWSMMTMVTVGYGDIVPNTTIERIFATCVLLIGAVMYATIFGSVAIVLQNLDVAQRNLDNLYDTVTRFSSTYNLPPHIYARILAYKHAGWNKNKGLDTGSLLNDLPYGVKCDVMTFIFAPFVKKIALFEDCEDNLMRAICINLRTMYVLKGDYIFHVHDNTHEMFFIRKGKCEVLIEDANEACGERVVAMLGTGSVFGEVAIVLQSPRTASVRAFTNCDMAYLDREHFLAVMENFPKKFVELQEIVIRRVKRDSERKAKKDGENTPEGKEENSRSLHEPASPGEKVRDAGAAALGSFRERSKSKAPPKVNSNTVSFKVKTANTFVKQPSKLLTGSSSSLNSGEPNSPTKLIKKQMSKIQMLRSKSGSEWLDEKDNDRETWLNSLTLEEKVDMILKSLVSSNVVPISQNAEEDPS